MHKDGIQCKLCGQARKPNITFFGEAIPLKYKEAKKHLEMADLLIVIGTSSKNPLNHIINDIPDQVPKVLIN